MKVGEWIPVSERFPEEWVEVITYQPNPFGWIIRIGVHIGHGKWREAERHEMMEIPVTHWMPLPELPKEN